MFEIDLTINEPFQLESGIELHELKLRVSVYGRLNADRSNAVLVYHALTGSSRIAEWWNGVIGDGSGLDTASHAFICVNYLGSCYGSTSASDLRTLTDDGTLPIVSISDIVRASSKAFAYLGIERFRAVVGGSVGGMLALQTAVDLPNITEKVIAFAATPLSALALGLNHIQRQAVRSEGPALARKIAVMSYRSHNQLQRQFGRRPDRSGEDPASDHLHRFDVGGYLDHQGDIFVKRFSADSYLLLTKAMDLFDLSDDDIRRINAEVTLVGISTDWLFPPSDVRALGERMQGFGVRARYLEIGSDAGHDAFLTESTSVSEILERQIAGGTARVNGAAGQGRTSVVAGVS